MVREPEAGHKCATPTVETAMGDFFTCRTCMVTWQIISGAWTMIAGPRCTLCGGSRLLKNGRPEVCSFLGCKDPTFDVAVEKARAALWRLFGFATSEARPNEAGEEQCARDRELIEKLIGVGGPRAREGSSVSPVKGRGFR